MVSNTGSNLSNNLYILVLSTACHAANANVVVRSIKSALSIGSVGLMPNHQKQTDPKSACVPESGLMGETANLVALWGRVGSNPTASASARMMPNGKATVLKASAFKG